MTLSPPSPYIFGPNLFANKLGFCYDPSLPIWADDPNSALFFCCLPLANFIEIYSSLMASDIFKLMSFDKGFNMGTETRGLELAGIENLFASLFSRRPAWSPAVSEGLFCRCLFSMLRLWWLVDRFFVDPLRLLKPSVLRLILKFAALVAFLNVPLADIFSVSSFTARHSLSISVCLARSR